MSAGVDGRVHANACGCPLLQAHYNVNNSPPSDQHNSSSQADLLHASYSSTMSLLSVPAVPGPAGGAAVEVLLPAGGAVGQQQQQQKPAGSDRAAADLFVSMMNGIGGPTPSLSRTSSSSSSSSGAAGRTSTVGTATA